jgi:hypothetical protein
MSFVLTAATIFFAMYHIIFPPEPKSQAAKTEKEKKKIEYPALNQSV